MAKGDTLGTIGCLCCGDPVPVKEQANGLARIDCPWCSFQGYARAVHSDKIIRSKMKPKAAAAAEVPTPKPAEEKETPPAEKKAARRSSGSIMDAIK